MGKASGKKKATGTKKGISAKRGSGGGKVSKLKGLKAPKVGKSALLNKKF